MYRGLRALCTVALFAMSGTAAAPAEAQDGSALKALDAQLPGDLANDPSRIDWQSYGAELVASAIVDESIPGGGAARRFEVRNAGEFIYLAGANVPLIRKVDRGDTVTVGFYARTIDAQTDDGKGVLRVRFQQNAEPYPGFGEETLAIGKEWDWYEVSTTAERALRSRDGIVALQFGRTRQTIEIGQVIVVTGAERIATGEPLVAAARSQLADLEMPDALIGLGTLLNDPRQGSWKFAGSAGTIDNRDEPQIWMMKATRFKIANAGTALTDVYATIPISHPIDQGDDLVIAIAARTIGTSNGDGRAIAASRIQATAPPFGSFAANRFAIGPNWQLIRIETKAPQSYRAGDAELQLYFGGSVQEVDLGPVYVLKIE